MISMEVTYRVETRVRILGMPWNVHGTFRSPEAAETEARHLVDLTDPVVTHGKRASREARVLRLVSSVEVHKEMPR